MTGSEWTFEETADGDLRMTAPLLDAITQDALMRLARGRDEAIASALTSMGWIPPGEDSKHVIAEAEVRGALRERAQSEQYRQELLKFLWIICMRNGGSFTVSPTELMDVPAEFEIECSRDFETGAMRIHIARGECPTCQNGRTRETVGLVCQTCGHDYGTTAGGAL